MQKTKAPQARAAFFFTALLLSWGIAPHRCFSQAEKRLSQEEKIMRSQEYYQEGKKLLVDGNYAEADKAFKKAQYLLSGAAPGAPFTAPEKTQHMAAAGPKPNLLAQEAYAASLSGSSQEAIELYLKAIQLPGENPNLYYNTAIEYLKTNQFKKAALFFKKVIQLKIPSPFHKKFQNFLIPLIRLFLLLAKWILPQYRRLLPLLLSPRS